MKRFYLATIGVAFVAVLAATVGFAEPAKHDGTTSAAATALPPLPANIKSRNRFIIGVKCDVPPFGYIDVQGKNAGFDVEVGRWFARYAFGRASRVTFVCAPTAAREPLLTSDRVDLVISTFTYTADRDTRIDFSEAYYKATGRLLVKNDGSVQKLSDIAGKRVATTSGSVYDRWMKNCFKNTEVVVNDTFSNAMLAFQQGRADAVMYDDAVLLPVAAADRNAKLTDDAFLEAPFAVAGPSASDLRRGEHEQRRVAEEDQLPVGTEQPSGLRDPSIRVAPDRRAVFADRQIEARIGEWHGLCAGLDQREVQIVLVLERTRGGELVLGDVDADRPSASSGKPRRHVRRATSELDDVETVDVRQEVHLGLRNAPDAPRRLLRPASTSPVRRTPPRIVPGGTVALDVIA